MLSIEDLYLNYVCHAILFFCTAFCVISLPGVSTHNIQNFPKSVQRPQISIYIFSVSFGLEYAGHEDLLHVEVGKTFGILL